MLFKKICKLRKNVTKEEWLISKNRVNCIAWIKAVPLQKKKKDDYCIPRISNKA